MKRMHIEIKALRHVVSLAKTLNYTKAAQALNLSQSALTRSIQTTEQRSNLRIFDRDRGSIRALEILCFYTAYRLVARS